MTETYCIILRDDTAASPDAVQLIAKATGRIAFDVRRELRDRIGVLATHLPKAQADALVTCLANIGCPALALPEAQLVQFPPVVCLEAARLSDQTLELLDLRGPANPRPGALDIPSADIVFLAAASVVKITTKKKLLEPQIPIGIELTGSFMYGDYARLVDAALPPVADQQSISSDHLLDIFAVEPACHLRLNASTFNFLQTGMKMQPTSIANLTEFIKYLALRCGQAHVDPSIRHILDGNPLTNLRFNSAEQYDAYLFWRIQLLYHPET